MKSSADAGDDLERYACFAKRFVAKLRDTVQNGPDNTQLVSLGSETADSASQDALHALYRASATRGSTTQHDKRGKHAAQIEAISECVLGVLAQQGRIGAKAEPNSTPPVVVELGAGRGLLGKLISTLGRMPLTVVDAHDCVHGFEETPDHAEERPIAKPVAYTYIYIYIYIIEGER